MMAGIGRWKLLKPSWLDEISLADVVNYLQKAHYTLHNVLLLSFLNALRNMCHPCPGWPWVALVPLDLPQPIRGSGYSQGKTRTTAASAGAYGSKSGLE